MDEHVKRKDFLEQVQRQRAALEKEVTHLTPEQMLLPGVDGEWSAKDVLAHISWFEREMIEVMRRRVYGGSDLWRFPQDERNQIIFEKNRGRPFEEVISEARQVFHDLWVELEKLSEAELNQADTFSGLPEGILPWKLLRDNTYSHYRAHAADLRVFRENLVSRQPDGS